MPIDKPARVARGSTTRIQLSDKSVITVPPVSVEQVRRCIRLDPDDGHRESDAEYVERVAEQFTILVGEAHAHLTGKLTLEAVQQIVKILFIAACGMNPEDYAKWQAATTKLAKRRTALETLRDLDAATVSLAAELSLRPSDVAAMPLADCAAIRQEIGKLTTQRSRFEAAIHGIKI